MGKVTLKDAYIFNGDIYGPGEVADLPDDARQALKEKGALDKDSPSVREAVTQESLAAAVETDEATQRAAAKEAAQGRKKAAQQEAEAVKKASS